MKVLITGSNGFIAKNLKLFLKERPDVEIFSFSKNNKIYELNDLINRVDFIFHLAGVNRSKKLSEFTVGNEILTQQICDIIKKSSKKIPILYSSSIQAVMNNPYGVSKSNSEKIISNFSKENEVPICIFRLPNVFGKWCKPNYNSVVATFCYNISHNIPINIKNSEDLVNLVYIDDVINHFIKVMDRLVKKIKIEDYQTLHPSYQITVGNLAKQLYAYKEMQNTNILERVGSGLTRALYSTYVSYLPKKQFSYNIKSHNDSRGRFAEMLKTPDCGQFSCFTILPNITRGNHYHHSKTEKFLVLKGKALFKFFNLETSETYQLEVNGDNPEIVKSIPGWAHNIKNIGSEEISVLLWSNEIFDQNNPDTFAYKI